MRLTGGRGKNEGRVEIFYNTEWGTVCDDNWDLNDANVVCRQLGLGDATEALLEAYFGEGKGNILLDEVACSGTETDLTECDHSGCMHTTVDTQRTQALDVLEVRKVHFFHKSVDETVSTAAVLPIKAIIIVWVDFKVSMNFHYQSLEKSSIVTPNIRKRPQTSSESLKNTD